MLFHVRETCPRCQSFCGSRLFYGISSGLGPRQCMCSKCFEPIDFGRREWDEMDAAGKFRYVAVSLLYMFLLGAACGAFAGTCIGYLNNGPHSPEVSLTRGVAYWPFGLAAAIAVAILQIARIVCSRRRHRGWNEPHLASRWSPLTNQQFLTLLCVLAPVALCWLMGALLR